MSVQNDALMQVSYTCFSFSFFVCLSVNLVSHDWHAAVYVILSLILILVEALLPPNFLN